MCVYIFVTEYNKKVFQLESRYFKDVTVTCIMTASLLFVTNQTVYKLCKNWGVMFIFSD